MLQESKHEELLDRTAEFTFAKEGMRARGDSVLDHLLRARRSQLRDGRDVAGDRGVLASNGQPS